MKISVYAKNQLCRCPTYHTKRAVLIRSLRRRPYRMKPAAVGFISLTTVILTHTTNCNPHNLTKCWLFDWFVLTPLLHATPHMRYVQNDLEFKVMSRSYKPYFRGHRICKHQPKFHVDTLNIKKNIHNLLFVEPKNASSEKSIFADTPLLHSGMDLWCHVEYSNMWAYNNKILKTCSWKLPMYVHFDSHVCAVPSSS